MDPHAPVPIFVESLESDLTCFDAENYGTLILMDSEVEFHPLEISKLENVCVCVCVCVCVFHSPTSADS